MRGVLAIDKPDGVTSFDVVRAVRRAFHTRKVGHTGTLDPFATGVLPVCVGAATRLVPWLQAGEKEYLATVAFGEETDTLDPTGVVVRRGPVPTLDDDDVASALRSLTGEISQVPPAFSAIKVQGRRAYAMARAGEAPELAARTVAVHAIDVVERSDRGLLVRVRCGPGVYVRALARDLGAALGVPAHLAALRRTRSGGFDEASCVALDALTSDGPLPPLRSLADAVGALPAVTLAPDEVVRVRQGRVPDPVTPPTGLPPAAPCRLLGPGGELVAIAERSGERLRLARVFPPSPADHT